MRQWLALGSWAALVVVVSTACGDDNGASPSAGAAGTTTGTGGDGTAGEGQAGTDSTSSAGAGGAPAGASGAGAGGADAQGELTDRWLSGTRLRAVLDTAGAAKRFSIWHDTKLDVDCTFQLDSEGTERCLPTSGGYVAYSDDKCKSPVAVFTSAQYVSPYVFDPTYTFVCGKGAALLNVGDKAVEVAQTWSTTESGCTKGPAPTGSQVFRAVGAAVSNSTFVATKQLAHEPRDARLDALVRVAEDGSRQVTSELDLSRKVSCNPIQRDDSYGCVPSALAYIETFFTSASCMNPAAYHLGYAQAVCVDEPTIVQDASGAGMGFYEVGEKLASVFTKSGTCSPYVPAPSLEANFYAVGKAVPFGDFPQLTASPEGPGRIQVIVLRGADAEAVADAGFYDSELKLPCGAMTAADGKRRCLPIALYSNNIFADDKCTQALVAIGTGATSLPAGTYVSTVAPGGGEAIFRVGAKVAEPANAYQLNGETCEALGSIAPGQTFYGTEVVAPSSLVELTTTVE